MTSFHDFLSTTHCLLSHIYVSLFICLCLFSLFLSSGIRSGPLSLTSSPRFNSLFTPLSNLLSYVCAFSYIAVSLIYFCSFPFISKRFFLYVLICSLLYQFLNYPLLPMYLLFLFSHIPALPCTKISSLPFLFTFHLFQFASSGMLLGMWQFLSAFLSTVLLHFLTPAV